jgi:hypothetical protein
MTSIVDQYHGDSVYAELYSLVKNRPLAKEAIKTASFDKEKTASLPSSAFAWEGERRFPVHTKEDTVASILYRSKLGSSVPKEVDNNLRKAAEIYGIDSSLFAEVKTASEHKEPTYALPGLKRLPLDSKEQIKVAEHVLCRDYSRLSLEQRAEAFTNLSQAAKTAGVSLSPFSTKLAGLTISSTEKLVDWLEARASACSEPIHTQAFDKLASALKRAPKQLTYRKELIKLAATVEQLDKKAGLDKFYDRKLPDPVATVFNTEKVAELTCDVAGEPVPCSVLMNLPPEVWEQVDAPELAEVAASGDEQTFKQVFDTLPLDLKVVLRDYV